MPQPLDPAVQALLDRTPRAPFVLPDPPPSAAELGLAIRARDRAAAPAPVDDFHGVITERTVPVRWGSVPARVYRPHSTASAPARHGLLSRRRLYRRRSRQPRWAVP